MRELIIAISEELKTPRPQHIQTWVHEQYARVSEVDGIHLTLEDAQEQASIFVVKEAITELDLKLPDLKQCQLLPVLSRKQGRCIPVFEVQPSYIRSLYQQIKNLTLSEMGVVYEKDLVVDEGGQEHIQHDPMRGSTGDAVMVYINCTYEDDTKQSFKLTNSELATIIQRHKDIKFGGASPFTDREWLDVAETALLLRIFREAAIWPYLPDNAKCVDKLHTVNSYMVKLFQLQEKEKNAFYSNRGYKVGEFVPFFSEAEKAKVKQSRRQQPTAQVVNLHEDAKEDASEQEVTKATPETVYYTEKDESGYKLDLDIL